MLSFSYKERGVLVLKEYKGYIFAFFAAFANASMALFAKLAVDVPTGTIVFFRNFICFGCVLFVVFFQKDVLKTNRIRLHLFRAACGLSAVYSYYYALKNLPLVNAIILANTSTLFIPLVVLVWLSTKIPMRRVYAMLIGFVGIVIFLHPDPGHFIDVYSLVGLFAGLAIATAMVGVRQLTKTESASCIIFYFFLTLTVISFFPMLASWKPIAGIMWVYVIGTGLAGTFFQFFLTKAYTYAPATKASCLMYFSVVFGGVYEYIIWQKVPDVWQIIGACLIVTGGLLALLDKKQAVRMGKKPK